MAKAAFELVAPDLKSFDSKRSDRAIEEILVSLGFKLEKLGRKAKRRVFSLAAAMASLIDAWAVRQQEPQFEALELPFPRRNARVSLELDAFRQENVDLITNMTEEMRDRINLTVDRALRQGTRQEDLAVELQRITRVGESRARLIGRDQALKLYGNLTQIRQTEAGIVKYTWNTSLDERVRDEHRALHGTEHFWTNPPFTGTGNNHPGQDYQCRCVAIPVIEGVGRTNARKNGDQWVDENGHVRFRSGGVDVIL